MRDNKIIYGVCIVFSIVITSIIILSSECSEDRISMTPKAANAAIYGTNYFWQDSLALSTSAVDSHFVVKWQQVVFWSNGADLLFRAGSPDTTSWSSRKFTKISAGQTYSFGSATKLIRFEYKASSGSGTLYMSGYKKSAQF